MLFGRIVETWDRIRATRSRNAKRAAAADLLERTPRELIPTVISYLSGTLPQGPIGVGHAAVSGLAAVPAASPRLTVTDVDAALSAVQTTTGPGSKAAKAAILGDLFGRATGQEQEFLRRLLLGDLRQGALEGVVADAVAAAAGVDVTLLRRAAMLGGELPAIAEIALTEGEAGLRTVRLQLFRAIQPMLASTAEDAPAAVKGVGHAAVEYKVDGARIQVHRAGDRVTVFTRNLRNVTRSSPEVVAAALELDVDSIILDGEVIAVRADGAPQPFQETMSRFSAGDGAAVAPFFFDCLHLDGRDLIDRTAAERWAALASAVPGTMLVPRIVTSDPSEAEAFYRRAITDGYEGVMVKALDSTYEAGRRGANWLKVKPVHTLDLVVIAVEWGSGRRRGLLSNIHLGARVSDGEFVMLGKTFKGMTDDMLAWQTERFLDLETDRTGHIVHVRPEQVVEIAFDGVLASPRYPAGMALRFARVVRYRDDKSAGEADTIETVRRIFEGGHR